VSAELSQSPRTSSPLSAADIDEAARRISSVVAVSPLQLSDRLSAAVGAQVYLKREDLQAVRSYKLRGAYNLLKQLTPEEIAAGVVCSSAGNHAQGFALACKSMGIHGRVYVPAKTPKQKRDRIRYHGGEYIELIVGGRTYDLAAAAALDDVARTGATLVPPYDDLRTMAGQGTIAVEILAQLDAEPDLVIVPVGGGGCVSGITTYLAARTTNTSVLGVEPAGAAAMVAALASGKPVTLEHVDQFVDGAAARRCSTCIRTRASSPSPPVRCPSRHSSKPTSRRGRPWCA
jgi:threonine dehydratase